MLFIPTKWHWKCNCFYNIFKAFCVDRAGGVQCKHFFAFKGPFVKKMIPLGITHVQFIAINLTYFTLNINIQWFPERFFKNKMHCMHASSQLASFHVSDFSQTERLNGYLCWHLTKMVRWLCFGGLEHARTEWPYLTLWRRVCVTNEVEPCILVHGQHYWNKVEGISGGVNILSTIICSACQPYCE